MKQVHWYPGHMNKTIREMEQQVKKIDILVILLDGRAPFSTFIPLFEELSKGKQVLLIFTKKDLANQQKLAQANRIFAKKYHTLTLNLREGNKKSVRVIIDKLKTIELKTLLPKVMILGVPNVGKSTLINYLSNQKKAKAEDRAGVTRHTTWFKVDRFYIMDTPGVLAPRVEDQNINYRLAIIGSIKQSILPIENVGLYLYQYLLRDNKLNQLPYGSNEEELNLYLEKENLSYRKFYEKLLKDFQKGRFGSIYLDDYIFDFEAEKLKSNEGIITE